MKHHKPSNPTSPSSGGTEGDAAAQGGVITVTSPQLPDLAEFHQLLQEIWDSKWITNNGSFHQRLEQALCDYLKVPYISLFTNGTLPLITAL